jgi:hypothetical protein
MLSSRKLGVVSDALELTRTRPTFEEFLIRPLADLHKMGTEDHKPALCVQIQIGGQCGSWNMVAEELSLPATVACSNPCESAFPALCGVDIG